MAKFAYGSLVANVPTTIQLDNAGQTSCRLTNRTQKGEIYFTTDGSTPTVGGNAGNGMTYLCVGSRATASLQYANNTVTPGVPAVPTITMISATAVNYAIETS